MPEGIPVNGDVITWARERAGLSPAEAGEKFPKIAALEAGTALRSYPQLEAMADKFKIPVAVFFFPERPNVPRIEETFRTLPNAEFAQLPRRIQLLLRKAKAFQLGLYELTQGRNPAERLITRDVEFSARMSPDTMTARVREYLGVTLAQQTAWRDTDEALKEWRRALHRVGIFVFKDAFREESFSGFSLYDDVFPIIYVNNSVPETRQIFTLFHELGHLLFHTSGIDPRNDEYVERLPEGSRHIEVLCNRFSAQFLLPENVFEAAFANLSPTERTAEILAARFHVSREFIFRKFLDRDLITQQQYGAAARRWAEQQKREGTGGDSYWNKLSYLGRDYVALAFGQYHANRIDETQLGEYLDMKPKHAKTLKARIGELNGQPGEAIRDIRSGFDASIATIDLIVATRKNILPRAIVDKWVELNGEHKSAKAAAMWDTFGDDTVTCMARDTRYLAKVWQAAWDLGNGDANIGVGRALKEGDLMKLYNNADVLPSIALDHYPDDKDADWSKIKNVQAAVLSA
jgi:Zn-dependent peptidase ImmA (M78 family)